MTPYARAIDRLAVLYRLRWQPSAGRLLQVVRRAEDALPLAQEAQYDVWALEDHAGGGAGSTSIPAPGGFSCVALHDVLDTLEVASGGGSLDALLRVVEAALVPGGVVTGIFDNRVSLQRILERRHASARGAHGHSIRAMRAALQRAGFAEPHFFHLLPDRGDPLRLVDTDRSVSRQMLSYEVSGLRNALLLPYLARRMAVALGVYAALLIRGRFFWALKPC